MLIVTKEDKHLYKFLKDAFSIMGSSTSQKYLLGEEGALHFSTFFIKGRIEIKMLAEKNGKMEEVDKNSFKNHFYTLKMRDDKSFELKENDTIFNVEEAIEIRAKEEKLYKGYEFVRNLEEIRTTVLGTLYKETDIFVPDRYLGLIKKMGNCEVYAKDNDIMCVKEQTDDKERLIIKTYLLFICEHDQPGGFNDAESRMQNM